MLPLSKLYGSVTYMRNKFFDWGVLKQHRFDVPIIVVGNLAVGGTGKTPHTEYIVEGLRHSYHLAVVSRGYKRRTKGFVMAGSNSSPRDIGDEPYQMYRKFGGDVPVVVCEDRVHGITELLKIDPEINLIVLDDAFQHRYVKPTVSVCVTEYGKPVFKDRLMPYGRLRESARGIYRADIVVVSKCPDDLQPITCRILSKHLNLYPPPSQYLFYSRYNYCPLRPVFADQAKYTPYLDRMAPTDSVLAVAGVGNPRPFIKYIKSHHAKVKVNVYPDHHNFTRKDIDTIKRRFESLKGQRRIIVTTEKDAVRLSANPYFPHELKPYIFYLPIEVDFINYGERMTFIDTIREILRQKNNSD